MEENTQNSQNVLEQNNADVQEQTNNADAKQNKKIPDNFAEKFEEILDKRLDGVAKSVLKSNGMGEDKEIQSFIDSYHQRKEEKTKKINDEMEILKKENAELKASIFKNELETNIKKMSGKLGFDEKYTNQITKLADLSEIKDETGKVNPEKLEEAINKVLEDCEAFKTVKQNETKNANGFTTIGAGHNEVEENSLLQRVSAAIKGY